jgi:hypothetical protein
VAERAPLLVDLAGPALARRRARAAPWLATLATLQTGYRRLLGSTARMVGDPLVRDWLTGMERASRQHEAAVGELYGALGLRPPVPPVLTGLAGALVSTARGVAGQVQGLLAGASGSAWRNLRQLQLANLDSMSGFAVVQQFGLAEGRPRVVEIAFPVVTEKGQQQLLLQELFLEFATDAVLSGRDV